STEQGSLASTCRPFVTMKVGRITVDAKRFFIYLFSVVGRKYKPVGSGAQHRDTALARQSLRSRSQQLGDSPPPRRNGRRRNQHRLSAPTTPPDEWYRRRCEKPTKLCEARQAHAPCRREVYDVNPWRSWTTAAPSPRTKSL